jgi:hypothetical protein
MKNMFAIQEISSGAEEISVLSWRDCDESKSKLLLRAASITSYP